MASHNGKSTPSIFIFIFFLNVCLFLVSKPFECNTCSTRFSRKFHLMRHMRQRGCGGTPVSEFPCTVNITILLFVKINILLSIFARFQICNKIFTRKDNLREHINKTHVEPQQRKDKVISPSHQNELVGSRLSKTQSAQRKFNCEEPLCGRSFSSRSTLVKHKLTHTTEKLHSCSQVGILL